MNLLLWVALGLSVGWAGLWLVLGRQVQRQGELEKKIEKMESRD
jgi:hypothetical protein